MENSPFDPELQNHRLTNKIVVGLERISEAFRVLLWDHAKQLGLSPIQIQLLVFIGHHKRELCTVSDLAKEFNMTKATISDAVRVLVKKAFLQKEISSTDSRSFHLSLTESGKQILTNIQGFANPIRDELDQVSESQLVQVYETLHQLIYGLNQMGILTVQRTCQACCFYENRAEGHYCHMLKQPLQRHEIRLDCPEFEGKT